MDVWEIDDIVLLIFSHLSTVDRLKLRSVSHRWCGIMGRAELWRELTFSGPLLPIVVSIAKNFVRSVSAFVRKEQDWNFNGSTSLESLVIRGASVQVLDLPSLTFLDARDSLIQEEGSTLREFLWLASTRARLKVLKLGWKRESKANRVFRLILSKNDSVMFPFQNLTHLLLNGCNARDSSLLNLAKNCFSLQILNLSCCGQITNEILEIFLKNSQKSLVDLNIRCCGLVRDVTTNSIKNCSELFRINLSCTEISFNSCMVLLESCPKLEVLDFCYVNDNRRNQLNACAELVDHVTKKLGGQLKMIGLGGFNISNNILQTLVNRCPNIEHIGIGGCPLINDEGLLTLARTCTALTNLNAHRLNITHEGIKSAINICKNLRTLCVMNCPNIPNNVILELEEKFPDTEEDW